MTDSIIKFPDSKRRLTQKEERLVRTCVNIIHNSYENGNPFVTTKQKVVFTESQIKTLLRKVFELNEDVL